MLSTGGRTASRGSASREVLHPGGGGSASMGVGQTPPALWDMVNKRAVRILLECILVSFDLMSEININFTYEKC